MANRRGLKKDINWLTSELITDSLVYLDINPGKDEKPVADIINTMITKRNELFSKINQPTSKIERKEVRKMYRDMISDLLETTNNCFEELSKLAKK